MMGPECATLLASRNLRQHPSPRQSESYRQAVRRQLAAYKRHIQLGLIAQGLLQYLALHFHRVVWFNFHSCIRTAAPQKPLSEWVVSHALRYTLGRNFSPPKSPWPCLRKSEVLQSHTMETAAQEIAALILAAALLAQERDRAAAGKVPVLRVSFIKSIELMRPLWLVFALGDDLLEDWQKRQLTQRFYAQARRSLTSKRRARSWPEYPSCQSCAGQTTCPSIPPRLW